MCLTQDLLGTEGGRRPEETLGHLLWSRQMPPKSSYGTGLVSMVLLLGGEGEEP